jgi:phosphatidylserine/phosphatidylglycerophosphate/cardiolipin synthase-like enzyme
MAATRKPAKVSISMTTSLTTVVSGQSVRVSGTVAPAGVRTVFLQNYRAGHWVTVAKAKSTKRGSYAFATRPSRKSPSYRVTAFGTTSKSLTRRLSVVLCSSGTAPAAPVVTAFQAPGKGTSAVPTMMAHLACAAAPGSTIRIAMFFISASSPDVKPVIAALETAHLARGVKVHIMLERYGFVSAYTIKRLSQFAEVTLCTNGCRTSTGASTMHTKTMTVSDTVWRTGVDPVLLITSSNLSTTQQHAYWQDVQLMADDPALTREVDLRWHSMYACARSKASCAGWGPPDSTHKVALSSTVYGKAWLDPNLTVRNGSAQRGTSVFFSPAPRAGNPLEQQLAGLSCNSSHKTVRLTIYKGNTSRMVRVAKILRKLRSGGCDVRVMLSRPSSKGVATLTLDPLRSAGIPVSCVSNMHQKYFAADALDRGRPTRLVTDGSQNLTVAGLEGNDEIMVTTSSAAASGKYAKAAEASYTAHVGNWNDMQKRAERCDDLTPVADEG